MEIKQEKTESDNIISSAGSVMAGIMLSRVTGFLRELGLAALFGTGSAADIFAAAFRIPNLLRRLLGEGAFNAAFIPKYSQIRAQKGTQKAESFASSIGTWLFLSSAFLSILGVIFANYIVPILLFGWKIIPEKLGLTIELTRLLFPYLFLVIVYSFCSAFLNTNRIFFLPSVASAVLNIVNILGILIGIYLCKNWGEKNLLFLISISILIGGIFQGMMTLVPSLKRGFRFSFSTEVERKDVLEFFRLILPGVLGFGIAEVNHIVDLFLASMLPEGSVSSLRYGNLVVFLPLALFGTSIYTALLPSSSDAAAVNNENEVARLATFGVNLNIAVLLPISAIMIFLSVPITSTIFERGAFSGIYSTPMTAGALSCYAYGLFAYGAVRSVAQAFYSLRNTYLPFKISIYTMILNIILNLLLIGPLKHKGLALATSISSIFNLIALIFLFKLRVRSFSVKEILNKFAVLLPLSCISALTAFLVFNLLSNFLGDYFLKKAISLFLSCGVGIGIYLLLGNIMRIKEFLIIKEKVKTIFR